jgi:hypothetical protein
VLTRGLADPDSASAGLRAAAVAYARRGWPVFPLHPIVAGRCGCGQPDCKAVGKHPVTRSWQRSIASVDAAEAAWRGRLGQRGIGLACGPRAGCFGFDIDPRHGGVAALAQLVERHGRLPRTPVARSGSGGLHIYFAWPDSGEVRNSEGKVGPGLDVRGVGGLMVLAPTLHASGNRYRWVVAPGDVNLAPAPAWLLDLIEQAKSNGHGRGTHDQPAEPVPFGQIHGYLTDLASHLARGAITDERVVRCLLRAAATELCEPRPRAEIEQQVAGLARWVANDCRIARDQRDLSGLADAIRRRREER